VAFSPDGHSLVAGAFAGGLIWDGTPSGKEAKDAMSWTDRGAVDYQLMEWDKALAEHSKAIELDRKAEKAIADLSYAIKLNPKLATAWYNRGLVYSKLKRWDKALADCSMAIELDREALAMVRPLIVLAIADYSKAVDRDPKDARACYNRANAYKLLKQWDKALADYSKAIELSPNDRQLRQGRGVVLVRLARWKEAAADFVELTALNRKNSSLWLDAAPLLVLAGDRDGYLRLCRSMADQFANVEDPADNEKVTKASLLLSNPPEVAPRTLERIARAVEKRTVTAVYIPYFRATLALAAYRKGDFQQALRYLPQTTQEQGGLGNRAICLCLLAMIRQKLGQPEDAQKSLAQAAPLIEEGLRKVANGERTDVFHDWLIAEILRREAEAIKDEAKK
jgi:tetratricopeptide (TPR) repeat protein